MNMYVYIYIYLSIYILFIDIHQLGVKFHC